MQVFARTPINLATIQIPHGQVYVIPERCKGCEICVEFCPEGVLRVSSHVNGKGYHVPEVVPGKENTCVHCQFCTMICPEFAIFTLEAQA